MFIPLGDVNPRSRLPVFNYLLISINVLIHILFVSPADPRDSNALNPVLAAYALYPAKPDPLAFLTSMFLHAGFAHLLFNMLFLYIFGDNVEDRCGHALYLVFYFAAGIVAALSHIYMIPPAQMETPMVGASGAISGVIGSYLVLFPRRSVVVWLWFWITRVPAWLFLGLWVFTQIQLAEAHPRETGGVAVWAHLGGFAFGAGLTLILRVLGKVTPGPSVRYIYHDR